GDVQVALVDPQLRGDAALRPARVLADQLQRPGDQLLDLVGAPAAAGQLQLRHDEVDVAALDPLALGDLVAHLVLVALRLHAGLYLGLDPGVQQAGFLAATARPAAVGWAGRANLA